jgi:hypothetical protein
LLLIYGGWSSCSLVSPCRGWSSYSLVSPCRGWSSYSLVSPCRYRGVGSVGQHLRQFVERGPLAMETATGRTRRAADCNRWECATGPKSQSTRRFPETSKKQRATKEGPRTGAAVGRWAYLGADFSASAGCSDWRKGCSSKICDIVYAALCRCCILSQHCLLLLYIAVPSLRFFFFPVTSRFPAFEGLTTSQPSNSKGSCHWEEFEKQNAP